MRVQALFFFIVLLKISSTHGQCPSPLFKEFSDKTFLHYFEPLQKPSLTTGNGVADRVLIGSQEIFSEYHRLIVSAKSQILFQTWRFDHDSMPADFLKVALQDLSTKRKAEGARTAVKVWLLINTTGLQNYQQERSEILNFVHENGLNSPYVNIHLGFYRANLLGANHVKNLIVDNKKAVVTGANFSHNFNRSGMLDAGWTLTGSAVHSMSLDFIEFWKKGLDTDIIPTALPIEPEKNCFPILFTRSEAYPNFTKTPQTSSSNWAFLHLVDAAKVSIDIFTPSLNNNTFISHLLDAVRRGVKVRVILSHSYESFKQSLPTRGGDNSFKVAAIYRELNTLKNPCESLHIKWFSENGLAPTRGARPPASHTKYMSVDGQVTYFGSQNMDNQSWVNSREIALFIDSRNKTQVWNEQIFQPYFQTSIEVAQCRSSYPF